MSEHSATALRVALAQWAPQPETEVNLEHIASVVSRASKQGATMVVFPEYAQAFDPPFSAQWVARAQPQDGGFSQGLKKISAEARGVLIVAGMLESGGESAQPSNSLVAVNETGIAHRSRKIHLFDAFSFHESSWLSPAPAEEAEVFRMGQWQIGLQTCYDLRFPEVSRRLVDRGAQLLIVPSQWVPGPEKLHQWRSLVIARAIESQAWVIAVDHPAPHGVGHSMVVDPMGRVCAEAGEGEELLVAELSLEPVIQAREQNPMGTLRRFGIHWLA